MDLQSFTTTMECLDCTIHVLMILGTVIGNNFEAVGLLKCITTTVMLVVLFPRLGVLSYWVLSKQGFNEATIILELRRSEDINPLLPSGL